MNRRDLNHESPNRPRRRATAWLFLPVALTAVVIAACGPSTGDLGSVPSPVTTAQPSLDAPTGEPTPGASGPTSSPGSSPGSTGAPVQTTTVRAYFFLGSFTDNAGLVPVLREIPKTEAVGAAAMAALLAGPNETELSGRPAMYTVVPEGTRFLGLHVDDGIATVNLSREFESGGGSASVLGRLAQVVFTLTQFPTVEGVLFELDGEPVDVFGGEGVVLDEAVDREDYTDQLPNIFVDSPAWGGVLANPGRIVGLANAFEATFQVHISDGEGRALADGPVTASCGTGCWGTFDVTVPYTIQTAGWGMLQVYELSARDGAIESLTEYPVWLTP